MPNSAGRREEVDALRGEGAGKQASDADPPWLRRISARQAPAAPAAPVSPAVEVIHLPEDDPPSDLEDNESPAQNDIYEYEVVDPMQLSWRQSPSAAQAKAGNAKNRIGLTSDGFRRGPGAEFRNLAEPAVSSRSGQPNQELRKQQLANAFRGSPEGSPASPEIFAPKPAASSSAPSTQASLPKGAFSALAPAPARVSAASEQHAAPSLVGAFSSLAPTPTRAQEHHAVASPTGAFSAVSHTPTRAQESYDPGLRRVLEQVRPDWGIRDCNSVMEKLAAIKIDSLSKLGAELRPSNGVQNVNQKLSDAGFRTMKPSTLEALRDETLVQPSSADSYDYALESSAETEDSIVGAPEEIVSRASGPASAAPSTPAGARPQQRQADAEATTPGVALRTPGEELEPHLTSMREMLRQVETRVDSFGADMVDRFSRMERKLQTVGTPGNAELALRFDTSERKSAEFALRFDTVERKSSELALRFDTVERKLDIACERCLAVEAVAKKLATIGDKIDDHQLLLDAQNCGIARVERKLEAQLQDHLQQPGDLGQRMAQISSQLDALIAARPPWAPPAGVPIPAGETWNLESREEGEVSKQEEVRIKREAEVTAKREDEEKRAKLEEEARLKREAEEAARREEEERKKEEEARLKREAKEAAKREKEEKRAKLEEEARRKREAEEAARREAEEIEKQEEEARLKREAEEAARIEEENRAKLEEEERSRKREAEEAAKREEETRAQQEEEARRRRAEAEAAKREAEKRTKQEEEVRLKREAEEAARREEEATRAKQEEEARRQREAEEAARREEEERAKLEEEARRKQEAEEAAKREEEQRAKLEEEARQQREAEEAARRKEEERAKLEEEARRQREAEEAARREEEERAKLEEEARRKEEAEEAARKEEEKRAQLEEEARREQEAAEAARKKEEARAKQEEVARREREAEEAAKREAEKRAKQNELRLKQEADEAAKTEAEERAEQEDKERRKREAEELQRKRQEEDRRKREADEASRKKEDEQRLRRGADEAAKREAEEQARHSEEESRQRAVDQDAKSQSQRVNLSGWRHPSGFPGYWVNSDGAGATISADCATITWSDGGYVSDIHVDGDKIHMSLDDDEDSTIDQGHLDGDRILWDDGDIWVRSQEELDHGSPVDGLREVSVPSRDLLVRDDAAGQAADIRTVRSAEASTLEKDEDKNIARAESEESANEEQDDRLPQESEAAGMKAALEANQAEWRRPSGFAGLWVSPDGTCATISADCTTITWSDGGQVSDVSADGDEIRMTMPDDPEVYIGRLEKNRIRWITDGDIWFPAQQKEQEERLEEVVQDDSPGQDTPSPAPTPTCRGDRSPGAPSELDEALSSSPAQSGGFHQRMAARRAAALRGNNRSLLGATSLAENMESTPPPVAAPTRARPSAALKLLAKPVAATDHHSEEEVSDSAPTADIYDDGLL